MKNIYKLLTNITILLYKSDAKINDFLCDLQKTCKHVYIAPNQEEAKKLISLHNTSLDIVISDINLSKYEQNIPFFLLRNEPLKLTSFLSILTTKITKHLEIKKNMQTIIVLKKLLNDEKTKKQKIALIATSENNENKILDFVADELLVKFEIDKDGVVASTSKNFAEIFGFREEYIINEKISKIVHGSILQKTLLSVTRHKKPVAEYITFNTITGIIIEPMVAIVPYFDTTGYLSTYTLYCTLQ